MLLLSSAASAKLRHLRLVAVQPVLLMSGAAIDRIHVGLVYAQIIEQIIHAAAIDAKSNLVRVRVVPQKSPLSIASERQLEHSRDWMHL